MGVYKLKVKDIPDKPILRFLANMPPWPDGTPRLRGCRFGAFDNSVSKAFPVGTPQRLIWAKMRSLIRRGLVDGCGAMHNCRGDYALTEIGMEFIKQVDEEEAMRSITDIEKLTEVQIKKYVDGGGVRCPFCSGDDIVGQSVQIEAGAAWQDMSCSDCNAVWTDSYKLVGVI
jgi:hydrogenase maturation factor